MKALQVFLTFFTLSLSYFLINANDKQDPVSENNKTPILLIIDMQPYFKGSLDNDLATSILKKIETYKKKQKLIKKNREKF